MLPLGLGDLACRHFVRKLAVSIEKPTEEAVDLCFLAFQVYEPDRELFEIWEFVHSHTS